MELMDEENIDLEDLKPRERAMIYLGLGKAYRYDGNECVSAVTADWGGCHAASRYTAGPKNY